MWCGGVGGIGCQVWCAGVGGIGCQVWCAGMGETGCQLGEGARCGVAPTDIN